VVDNSIDGVTGSVNPNVILLDGIICNGVNTYPYPNYYNVVGNTIKDCYTYNVNTYYAKNVNIVGNTIVNSNYPNSYGTLFYNQATSFVNFSENSLTHSGIGNYFIFLDASDGTAAQPNTSGITISDNDFNGSVNQWGIVYYSSNLGGNANVLIENNRTHNVKSVSFTNQVGQYASMVGFASAGSNTNSAISYTHRNNLGNPSGAGFFIPDVTIPLPLNSNVVQSNSQLIPSAIGWYRVLSGSYEHVGGILRVFDPLGYTNNANCYVDDELWIDVNGYGNAGTIDWVRHSNYANGPVIGSGRIGNDGGPNCLVDLYVSETGQYPLYVSLYSPRGAPLLTKITNGASTPASSVTVLSPINGISTSQNMNVAGTLTVAGTNVGASLGNTTTFVPFATGWWRLLSGSYEYVGGILRISAPSSDNNTYTDEEIYISVDGYGSDNGLINWVRHSQYGGADTVSQIRIGNNGGATVYCDVLVIGTGSSPITVAGIGPRMQPFITPASGASTPSNNLVSMGPANGLATSQNVIISGSLTVGSFPQLLYPTSTSADIGSASLPSNPVGFIQLKITGNNVFKIPYYNL